MTSKTVEPSNLLEQELDKFTKLERRLIYRDVSQIELNSGCSNYCDFCGEDAAKGITDFIPFPVLEKIADEMATLTDRVKRHRSSSKWVSGPETLYLYGATDPLDYQDGNKDYFDVFRLFSDKGFKIFTSTAIPKRKEQLAIDNLTDIDQVSISHMNRKRLATIFEKLGVSVYVDLGNHLIHNGENIDITKSPRYAVKVEGSLNELLAELRKEHPSLAEEARFYDLRIDGNKFRHTLESHKDTVFLFCADTRLDLSRYCERVVDRDLEGVVPVGRAIRYEKENRAMSFGPFEETRVTPKGIFNYAPLNEYTGRRDIIKILPA